MMHERAHNQTHAHQWDRGVPVLYVRVSHRKDVWHEIGTTSDLNAPLGEHLKCMGDVPLLWTKAQNEGMSGTRLAPQAI